MKSFCQHVDLVKLREHLLDQVAREGLFADGLFSQSQPELTGFQSHVLVRVLRALKHVLVKDKRQ